jgi:hypothetical protein
VESTGRKSLVRTFRDFLRPPAPTPGRPLTPTISLCHSTARLPDGWVEAFQTWQGCADNPQCVEYILTVDQGRSDELTDSPQFARNMGGHGWHSVKLDINQGRRCAVDGWNSSAAASSGALIVTVSDDWMPPNHWDTDLLEAIPDLAGEYVLDVDAGESGGLLFFSLLTRAYYRRLGGRIFFPEYFGMLADNDFTEEAKAAGVIVDCRHLKFPHAHPAYGTAENDATYRHQHRYEAWERGKAVLKKRWPNAIRDNIIVCLPGDHYSGAWVAHWTRLYGHLMSKYGVGPMFKYSTNLYETRASMLEGILDAGMNQPADFVLMIDDDNVLSPAQFDTLFDDLARNPHLDGVAGWYWVTTDVYDVPDTRTSAGEISEAGDITRWTYDELAQGSNPMRPIQFSGLGVTLLRYAAVRKLGAAAFVPVLSDQFKYGFAGDDQSFFLHARAKDMKFAVDRRIKVPHLKLRSAEAPNFRHRFPVIE